MKMPTKYIAVAILALLTACEGSENIGRNSGVTAEESLALNEIENMLNASGGPDTMNNAALNATAVSKIDNLPTNSN